MAARDSMLVERCFVFGPGFKTFLKITSSLIEEKSSVVFLSLGGIARSVICFT